MKHSILKPSTIAYLQKQLKDPVTQIPHFEELKLKYQDWNKKHNLFSKYDLDRFEERHLLDSLSPLPLLTGSTSKKWLDIGCGTGFPILPLAIALPEYEFVGIEPRSKRVSLLNQMRRTFGLSNVSFHCAHAENFETDMQFDYCSTRAVGNLQEDWKRSEPFLKTGGSFITFKTKAEKLEIPNPQNISPYQFNDNQDQYYLISIQK